MSSSPSSIEKFLSSKLICVSCKKSLTTPKFYELLPCACLICSSCVFHQKQEFPPCCNIHHHETNSIGIKLAHPLLRELVSSFVVSTSSSSSTNSTTTAAAVAVSSFNTTEQHLTATIVATPTSSTTSSRRTGRTRKATKKNSTDFSKTALPDSSIEEAMLRQARIERETAELLKQQQEEFEKKQKKQQEEQEEEKSKSTTMNPKKTPNRRRGGLSSSKKNGNDDDDDDDDEEEEDQRNFIASRIERRRRKQELKRQREQETILQQQAQHYDEVPVIQIEVPSNTSTTSPKKDRVFNHQLAPPPSPAASAASSSNTTNSKTKNKNVPSSPTSPTKIRQLINRNEKDIKMLEYIDLRRGKVRSHTHLDNRAESQRLQRLEELNEKHQIVVQRINQRERTIEQLKRGNNSSHNINKNFDGREKEAMNGELVIHQKLQQKEEAEDEVLQELFDALNRTVDDPNEEINHEEDEEIEEEEEEEEEEETEGDFSEVGAVDEEEKRML